MKTLILFLLAIPIAAIADCFVVGDLKGHSTREYNEFELVKDGISSNKFIIEIDGYNSSVTPNNMICMQIGSHSLLCLGTKSEGQAAVETWSVYPDKSKAVYTKSINGYGLLNGGSLFVGSIKGYCE